MEMPDGNAIVYCEGAFNTPNGKTAHGLVRFTERYKVLSVIDSRYAGQDAGNILDNRPNGIPVVADIHEAIRYSSETDYPATYFVIGLAPDGGRMDLNTQKAIPKAINYKLNIDSGLHDYLQNDPDITCLARQANIKLRDIRKPKPIEELHFFSGKIDEVKSLKIAVLGTDSAVGKRTTAWILIHALRKAGITAEMIGTGQTAWMQGASYSIIIDSIINDFVSGEIEHAVYSAWIEKHPKVIIIEGQGSLMNPAYPGGFEILAAGRPDMIILQHAPARKEYDGFPGYPLHPVEKQIKAIELISGKPVVAITINHENIAPVQLPVVCKEIEENTGLAAIDVLIEGAEGLIDIIMKYLHK
ncbi:MAG: DUF1611 domain-containing protein [Bacteroidia bacterium]|nr:DUF1611 domain-containing protein [Bacteroidia bacterium]